MLDWDTFRVMLTISQEGSLSGAARALNVNQATVGRKLQRAEGEIGAKLFNRMNNGLYPTEAGLAALTCAAQIEKSIHSLQKTLQSKNNSGTGKIRLSMPQSLLGPKYQRYISDFCLQEPGITFQLTATNKYVSFDDRDVDVVIRADNRPSSGLWGYRLDQLTYCYAASRSFLNVWGQSISENPAKAEFPVIDWSTGKTDACAQHLAKTFPKATEYMISDALDSILPLVEGGVGVGRVLRENLAGRHDLVSVLDCHEIGAQDVWVLTHQDFRDTPHIRKFMDHMRDALARPTPNLHLAS